MIKIKPIAAPFFDDITQADVLIKSYNLTSTEDPVITLNLYTETGLLYREISQPVPVETIDKWGHDNDFLIDWVFRQNSIEKA